MRTLFSIIIGLLYLNSYAQDRQKADSLEQILSKATKENINDTSYINILVELGELKQIFRESYWDTIIKLSEKYLQISKNDEEKKCLLRCQADALNNVGYINQNHDSISKALDYYMKSLETREKIKDQLGIASTLNNIGYIYKFQGNIPNALLYYKRSLKIRKEIKDSLGIATSLNNIGYVYKTQGDIPKALEYLHQSLKIYEKIGDNKGRASSLNNIGLIYKNQEEYNNALEYYLQSIEIRKEIDDKKGIAESLNNIGSIYNNLAEQGSISKEQKDSLLNKALDSYFQCLSIGEETIGAKKIAACLSNIAGLYSHNGDPEIKNDIEESVRVGKAKAIEYYKKSLEINERIEDKYGIAYSLNNLGTIILESGDITKAFEYARRSLVISQEIGYPNEIKFSARLLSEIYEKKGDGFKALEMYKLYVQMKDSINNNETQKAAAKQLAKYEYEKQKVIDDAENAKLIAIEKQEKEKQKLISYSIAGGLGLVVIFLIIVFNRLRVTRRQKRIIEEQKQEVEEQKLIVEEAHDQLEEKNRDIMDSIAYAKRIQSAILPPQKIVKEYLRDSFILYKPKDIVAGDFYWMEHKDGKILFAAADCTGHGVPGAMVSVVCNNGLNRAVREHGLTEPGRILDKTREIVIQEFEKSEEEVKDGMDIALCSLKGNTLEYAGAHNPLWIIRNGEILETKSDRQPIGLSRVSVPFTTHTLDLQTGDTIYIFSDGYLDQFGGENGKKFKSKAFKDLLLSIQDKSMEEQSHLLDENFESWRGKLEQIDDVCIMGVRI